MSSSSSSNRCRGSITNDNDSAKYHINELKHRVSPSLNVFMGHIDSTKSKLKRVARAENVIWTLDDLFLEYVCVVEAVKVIDSREKLKVEKAKISLLCDLLSDPKVYQPYVA
jgi:hypothetical protein